MFEHTITETIQANPDCGVAVWKARKLRAMPGFKGLAGRIDDQGQVVDQKAGNIVDDLALQIAFELELERQQGIKTLIVSEENILGTMTRNFGELAFYPRVKHRMAAYAQILPMTPRKVTMAVRDYGSVWSSAYYYSQQRGNEVPAPDTLRAAMMDDALGWKRVARCVRQVWPGSTLQMWQQEGLGDHLKSVCSAITGLDKDMIVVPEGKVNARNKGVIDKNLFEKEEIKVLSERYRRHLRRIKQRDGVEWIGGAI